MDSILWSGIKTTRHGQELVKYLKQNLRATEIALFQIDASNVGQVGRMQGRIEALSLLLADLDVDVQDPEMDEVVQFSYEGMEA